MEIALLLAGLFAAWLIYQWLLAKAAKGAKKVAMKGVKAGARVANRHMADTDEAKSDTITD
jgi:hypothetical protein